MISIGFTGTRWGMVLPQHLGVVASVSELDHQKFITQGLRVEAHHGDCVGADAEFHSIARGFGLFIAKHPGPLGEHSAGCQADECREPLPHMRRNANIVAESTVMIAAPAEEAEQKRGGTWSTIRMARRAKKPLAIVYPSGRVEKERWSW